MRKSQKKKSKKFLREKFQDEFGKIFLEMLVTSPIYTDDVNAQINILTNGQDNEKHNLIVRQMGFLSRTDFRMFREIPKELDFEPFYELQFKKHWKNLKEKDRITLTEYIRVLYVVTDKCKAAHEKEMYEFNSHTLFIKQLCIIT